MYLANIIIIIIILSGVSVYHEFGLLFIISYKYSENHVAGYMHAYA